MSEKKIDASSSSDLLDALGGIEAGTTVAELRSRRPDVVQHTQGSYDALFHPADAAGFTPVERAQAALRAAHLAHNTPLTAHYRQLLYQLGETEAAIAAVEQFPNGAALSPRIAAILHHVDLLTQDPAAATPAHLAALQAQGLTTRNIVTLSQLIAFLSFQVRALAALQLLKGGN